MSTRSNIIVKQTDGTWKKVYCHWDGYLSHNGRILYEYYNTQAKAERLVKNGDLSVLAEKCTKPKGHSFSNPVPGYCVYYGRDRKEPDGYHGALGYSLLEVWPAIDTWAEFVYVWDGKQWYVGGANEGTQALTFLGQALFHDKQLAPSRYN